VTSDRLIDDVLKELDTAVAALEYFSFNYFLHMVLQGGNIAFCFCDFGDFRDSGVVWRRRLHFERLNAQDFRIPLSNCPHSTACRCNSNWECHHPSEDHFTGSLRNLLIKRRLEISSWRRRDLRSPKKGSRRKKARRYGKGKIHFSFKTSLSRYIAGKSPNYQRFSAVPEGIYR
jgi:hypothetical protein